MSEPDLEKPALAPWRVAVASEDIPEGGRHFALVADADTRAGIAFVARVRDLPRLEAHFEVTRRDGGGLRVVGRVSASVGQTCVVSLEPMANTIEESVDLLFTPKPAATKAAEPAEGHSRGEAKWGEPEPLIDGIVDLGAIATEFLILGLDPYPRKPGAVFEPPPDLQPESGPFRALAGWSRHRNEH